MVEKYSTLFRKKKYCVPQGLNYTNSYSLKNAHLNEGTARTFNFFIKIFVTSKNRKTISFS